MGIRTGTSTILDSSCLRAFQVTGKPEIEAPTMKAKLQKKLYRLIHCLEEIQAEAQEFEERYEVQLRGVHPDQYKCALNLRQYLDPIHK